MTFSFIHTADIHLGRPFSDLPELNDKTEIFNLACKNALNKIVDFAISKNVNFVLISGDSFDSEEHDLSAKLLFIESLKKLADNGIKSYVICGNHDSIELYKKNSSYFKFDEKYKDLINITGVTTETNIQSYEPLEGVKIHSVSFKHDESENQTELMLKTVENSEFNIGLIHCDLDKNESKYAPTSREDLRKLGYNYFALGHIHIPEVKEDGASKIVYAGSPQGRTKKETGAHGCYYVQVNDTGTIDNIEFIPTDFVRFKNINIDCSECENKLDVFELISESVNNITEDVELLLLEINLTGVTKSYVELNGSDNLFDEYRQNFTGDDKTAVYKINNNTIPSTDESEFIEDTGIIGIIYNGIKNGEINIDNIYEKVKELHESFYKKLGLDSESKEYLSSSLEVDREEITENVIKEIKSLCSEIYSFDKV